MSHSLGLRDSKTRAQIHYGFASPRELSRGKARLWKTHREPVPFVFTMCIKETLFVTEARIILKFVSELRQLNCVRQLQLRKTMSVPTHPNKWYWKDAEWWSAKQSVFVPTQNACTSWGNLNICFLFLVNLNYESRSTSRKIDLLRTSLHTKSTTIKWINKTFLLISVYIISAAKSQRKK